MFNPRPPREQESLFKQCFRFSKPDFPRSERILPVRNALPWWFTRLHPQGRVARRAYGEVRLGRKDDHFWGTFLSPKKQVSYSWTGGFLDPNMFGSKNDHFLTFGGSEKAGFLFLNRRILGSRKWSMGHRSKPFCECILWFFGKCPFTSGRGGTDRQTTNILRTQIFGVTTQ